MNSPSRETGEENGPTLAVCLSTTGATSDDIPRAERVNSYVAKWGAWFYSIGREGRHLLGFLFSTKLATMNAFMDE